MSQDQKTILVIIAFCVLIFLVLLAGFTIMGIWYRWMCDSGYASCVDYR